MDTNKIVNENKWHGQYIEPKELRIGLKIENQKIKDKKLARMVVLNKLLSDPNYYSKIQRMVG